MKPNRKLFSTALLILSGLIAYAQEEGPQTIFNKDGQMAHGGYGTITNKFTMIDGKFANMVGIYGGWFINRRLMLGIGAAATTNDIRVPAQFSVLPEENMSYEYGQVGLQTEYVVASNKPIHVCFQLLTGAGFTVQYQRFFEGEDYQGYRPYHHDDNWFFIAEPGVQVELNLLRWMRFSPGVSYRIAYGSEAQGLADADISGASVNLTLKFGKF